MCSTFNASSRPAAWTLDQPTTSPEAEVAVNSCEFQSSGFNASGFAAAELSSTGFQRVSESLVEENGLTLPDTNISPDAGMVRSIVKIEARFANKLTGYSIWKISTGLLVSPDLVVAGSEAVYDAEYQLGAATQVKCYIGYRGRGFSDIQPRYGQRVVFSADWTEGSERRSRDIAFIQVAQPFALSVQNAPVQEEPVEQAPITVTVCTNCSAHEAPVPEAVAQPEPEPEVTQTDAHAPDCVEPAVEEPELEIPAPAAEPIPEPELEIPAPAAEPTPEPVPESDYVDIGIDNTPDTSVSEEVDPFYETLKTVSQVDTKTLDIESSLIDDVGQFVSVAAGSLVSHVVGAETISSGKATKLSGVSERALLAEASVQAVFAIEQSSELDEIIAAMKENWTTNAPQVEQLSELLAPYLAEAARCIIEYHQEDEAGNVTAAKAPKRRNLGIRQFPTSEATKGFVKGIFEPTLPLAGREDVFSSLGPVLRSAVSAVEQIVCQAGNTAVDVITPKLLTKYQGTAPSAGDIEATRVLVQRAIMADAAYQALSTFPREKLQVLRVIPLDAELPQADNIFDFIKNVIQKIGPVCLHDAKQAVHKFVPLLVDTPAKAPQPVSVVPAKAASSKFALRDFLSSKKGYVKTL
ncbi:hypothetical protein AU210_015515 [Fusarium oxysporum f. sp. radicis-cucumerinum]|uniref:Peptidase S1 domain-containing protein n=1 Tax=Fusarium oxysporum f. sp. radicis-cucumerinum TaxID=327505 RepID=A0A2H3FYR1_FUSOX|nr:hypothetical protein AU210_015515 [Fusarium oxysporum f. sp. radicis-cucumerinum]